MAKKNFLDFEQPIAELESKIEELRYVQTESAVDISDEIDQLSKKSNQLTKDIYSNLTPWQITKIARHADRPYTLDYVREIFTDFVEMHGDRHFADDKSIIGGLARFNGQACMVIGHQKGRDTKERTLRNFGMTRPEGYRKALRLMKTAEKFKLPVFTFVDTPGAFPGIDAEERGQSEAIGRNIFEMAQLKTPIITTIIGEGGSGGALAISVADQVLMLQYAVYSVISPEGCASILWKTGEKASEAAEAMGINLTQVKLTAFALSSAWAGFAGVLFAAKTQFINPASFTFMDSCMILAMVVLGGMGHIPGVILGAVLLSILPEVLRYGVGPAQMALFGKMLVDPESLRMLVFGLALVLVMRFKPAGLWPSPERKRELSEAAK